MGHGITGNGPTGEPFESMSTEELEAFVGEAMSAEDSRYDAAEIQRALEVIASREEDTFFAPEEDVEAAYNRFMTEYLPAAEERRRVLLEAISRPIEPPEEVLRRRRVLRRALSAAASLLIAVGLLLALAPTARAAVGQWIRETYDSVIAYRFFGEKPAEHYTACEFGWLPEGYAVMDVVDTGTEQIILIDDGGEGMVLSWGYMSDGYAAFFDVEPGEVLIETQVNQYPATYHRAPEGSQNLLHWIEEDQQVQIVIAGYADQDTMVKIGENLILK